MQLTLLHVSSNVVVVTVALQVLKTEEAKAAVQRSHSSHVGGGGGVGVQVSSLETNHHLAKSGMLKVAQASST